MQFQLETPKTVTVRQPETVELTEVVIERVLDDVLNKKVVVWLKDFPHPVELGDLSGDNYDNPQWTNESVLASVQGFFNSLS
jgi:hypothetical protein